MSGIDLVRDNGDHWLILEDNLRVPSGIGYAMTSRRLVRSVLPELEPPAGVVPVEGAPELLHKTLLAGLPPNCGPDGTAALLSAGPIDSAFYEHRLLAESMDVPLVTRRAGHPRRRGAQGRAAAGRAVPADGRGQPAGRRRGRRAAAG